MGDLIQPAHLILLLILFPVHLVPTFIAGVRAVKHFGWIFAVNVFLGWTVIGWVVALIWAMRDPPKYVVASGGGSGTLGQDVA